MWWRYAIGYAFSIAVGGLLTGFLIDYLWKSMGWNKQRVATVNRSVIDCGLFTSTTTHGQ